MVWLGPTGLGQGLDNFIVTSVGSRAGLGLGTLNLGLSIKIDLHMCGTKQANDPGQAEKSHLYLYGHKGNREPDCNRCEIQNQDRGTKKHP